MASPVVSSPTATHLFFSITHDHFISQLIVHPTRGKSIRDLICTNSADSISAVQTVDNLPVTDHNSIEFLICFSSQNHLNVRRSYIKADFCVFQEFLFHIPWNQLNFESNVEDARTCWKGFVFYSC